MRLFVKMCRNQDSNGTTDAASVTTGTVKTEVNDASFSRADDESDSELTLTDVKSSDSFNGDELLQSAVSSDHVDYCSKFSGNKKRTDTQVAVVKQASRGKLALGLSPRKLSAAKPMKTPSKPNAQGGSSEERQPVFEVADEKPAVPTNSLCDICGQVFDDSKLYRAHKMKFHRRRKKDVPVQCTQCGLSFANRPNLRRHMYQHTGERPHLCQHCGEGFIQRKSLLDHVTSRHPEKLDPNAAQFVCRKCGEKLHNSYSYRRHVKLECEQRPGGGATAVPAVRRARANDEAKPHACEKCGRRFALKASLIIHSRLHTDEWTFHIGRRRYGIAKAENVCKTCGKRFNYRATLAAHERVHTGEKPFKCTFCGLAVVTASKLHAHLLRHTGETPHICGTCGKGFRLRANLQSHERTHTGEKPFTCPQCGRQLAHAAQLIDHMRIHTGEKPYKCKVCGKQMRQRAHLATHMRTHTGERPYKCQLCDKSYKQIADLRCHYRRMHQFELPKNADRRPFSDENIRALTATDNDSQTQSDAQ